MDGVVVVSAASAVLDVSAAEVEALTGSLLAAAAVVVVVAP